MRNSQVEGQSDYLNDHQHRTFAKFCICSFLEKLDSLGTVIRSNQCTEYDDQRPSGISLTFRHTRLFRVFAIQTPSANYSTQSFQVFDLVQL